MARSSVSCRRISLVPGVSRSGATIAGGLFRGLDRVSATRMSFFLGVPTLVASGAFQAVTEAGNIGAPGGVGWVATTIGTVVSGVVAYVVDRLAAEVRDEQRLHGLRLYRVLLAGVIITLLLTGVLPAA